LQAALFQRSFPHHAKARAFASCARPDVKVFLLLFLQKKKTSCFIHTMAKSFLLLNRSKNA